jgi:putative endonuclease
MGAFVYMLRCSDGSLYVGSATGDDLLPRIDQHNAGAFPGGYTWSRRPVTLIWSEHFERITDAIAGERRIKGWSRAGENGLGKWQMGSVADAGEAPRRTPIRGMIDSIVAGSRADHPSRLGLRPSASG